ncbi:molybdopterin synthase catalytic subunit [Plodia interpunctella]|uniref:molybdopterin synthase catalytic subunit n=1 Tax=Plodia interpunctella TaxID=58824 RepID=UPI0023689C39|nr:molybdopterin synthase catalytic subunit [Plodia interpunctella]XP_053613396.1 molybdopterin synthase catalytic subunit [Plodia interpunctella]XP_053613397.1 molybdopterin synthase catalytic subunit [Plodia interpunctella]
MDHLKLTVDVLSVDVISDLVLDNTCGAVSIFVGTTRDNFEGKKVVRLEYEAYESMALKAMKSICEEVRGKWPAVHSIAIYHRLGEVPCREASVVIAVSSPHRRDSLDAVSHCIDQLKATVPIWKKEVYEGAAPEWKENKECTSEKPESHHRHNIDKSLVQINVSNEELEKRIQNFIERKREQVNISNIQDFTPEGVSETGDTETCARVRTQFVRRSDSKGHLKIRKVHNEWGPQTVHNMQHERKPDATGLPVAIAERVLAVEKFLNIGPVAPDIYRRLKEMEDKIAYLETVSPEYAQFWRSKSDDTKQESVDYEFTADDIERKIELLERQGLS